MDIEAKVKAFDTGFGVFISWPHRGVDLEMTAACDPLFLVGGWADEGSEVKSEGVDSAGSDCGSHCAEMCEGGFFGQ